MSVRDAVADGGIIGLSRPAVAFPEHMALGPVPDRGSLTYGY